MLDRGSIAKAVRASSSIPMEAGKNAIPEIQKKISEWQARRPNAAKTAP